MLFHLAISASSKKVKVSEWMMEMEREWRKKNIFFVTQLKSLNLFFLGDVLIIVVIISIILVIENQPSSNTQIKCPGFILFCFRLFNMHIISTRRCCCYRWFEICSQIVLLWIFCFFVLSSPKKSFIIFYLIWNEFKIRKKNCCYFGEIFANRTQSKL